MKKGKIVILILAVLVVLFFPIEELKSSEQQMYEKRVEELKSLNKSYYEKNSHKDSEYRDVFLKGNYTTISVTIFGIKYTSAITESKTNVFKIKVCDWQEIFPGNNEYVLTENTYQKFYFALNENFIAI